MAVEPSRRPRLVEEAILNYARSHSEDPDPAQAALQQATRERTARVAMMQIGHDQAVFMEILVRAIGAREAIEIGTFTGYSALAIARGLGPTGHLLCCDINEEWAAIAREHWEQAGIRDRIDFRIAPALDTIRSLPAGKSFDLAFIDADKPGYMAYYEELLPRIRTGGLILADNTLSFGRVVDPNETQTDVVAIREFNKRVAEDSRVQVSLLTIGDGLSVIQKL